MSDQASAAQPAAGFLTDDEIRAQVGRCAKCGTCRAHCPVFDVVSDEPDAPRGKVQLLGYLSDGLPASERLREIYSRCLLCKTCSSACPNGVPIDTLVLEARSRLAGSLGVEPAVSLGLRGLLASPERLGLAARAVNGLRSLGLDALAAKLSPKVGRWLGRVPDLRRRPLLDSVPRRRSLAAPRARVAYFPGCLNNLMSQGSGEATLEVLLHLGVEVWLPDQICCGLPALAQGDLETARRQAERNLQGLLDAIGSGCDLILVDCGSCGTTLRDYEVYGFGTGSAAREIKSRVRDVYTFILELGLDPSRLGPVKNPEGSGESGLRVTYHDPCHLKRGMGVYREPREILRRIPALELVEMTGADRCCGGAGSFMVTQDQLSAAIARPKVEAIDATGASLVATSCGACSVQLDCRIREAASGAALTGPGAEVRAVGVLNLLRAALRSGRQTNIYPIFTKTS